MIQRLCAQVVCVSVNPFQVFLNDSGKSMNHKLIAGWLDNKDIQG